MECIEERVDMREITSADRAAAQHETELNHSVPGSQKYMEAMSRLPGALGDGSCIAAPVQGVCWQNITIGNNVFINSNLLAMARGGITADDVMLAANVQLITNNHDLYDRHMLLCGPIVL